MKRTSTFHTFAIRRLYEHDLANYTSHLRRLDRAGRWARYGYSVSDEALGAYAEGCFARNAIVHGYFQGGVIHGVGELHVVGGDPGGADPGGELAFSVESRWRRRGIGSALMEHLMLAARNRHLTQLTLQCSAENDAMLALARKYAASLTRTAYNMKGHLPTSSPNMLSRLREAADNCADVVVAVVGDRIRRLSRDATCAQAHPTTA